MPNEKVKVYKTGGYGTKITEVECQKSTDVSVWVPRWTIFGGDKEQFERRARHSGYDNYWDTWEEAKAHLIDRAAKRVERAKYELQQARSEFGQAESLKREAELSKAEGR